MDYLKWLSSSDCIDDLSQVLLLFSVKLGEKKKNTVDVIKFIDPQIPEEIFKLKTTLHKINANDFNRSRSVCNPYETVGRFIFQNRSAVKLANIDAVTKFMFTDPKDENGDSMVMQSLNFADICGGPGGFTEYIMWRTNGRAKGYGITLRGSNDFRPFVSSEDFDCYYGEDGDGNIMNPRNLVSFKKHTSIKTHGIGVDIALADGGFDVVNENLQEIHSQQLIICEIFAVLSVLSDEGSCLIKFFDCFTKFTVGLIYLLYKSFKKICILKPKSSRPANSEKYIICKYKKSRVYLIEEYLYKIIDHMWNGSKNPIFEIVPNELLLKDEKFFKYIVESNNTTGRNQMHNLSKIISFIQNDSLAKRYPAHQQNKQCCLRDWHLLNYQQKKILKFGHDANRSSQLIPCYAKETVLRKTEQPNPKHDEKDLEEKVKEIIEKYRPPSIISNKPLKSTVNSPDNFEKLVKRIIDVDTEETSSSGTVAGLTCKLAETNDLETKLKEIIEKYRPPKATVNIPDANKPSKFTVNSPDNFEKLVKRIINVDTEETSSSGTVAGLTCKLAETNDLETKLKEIIEKYRPPKATVNIPDANKPSKLTVNSPDNFEKLVKRIIDVDTEETSSSGTVAGLTCKLAETNDLETKLKEIIEKYRPPKSTVHSPDKIETMSSGTVAVKTLKRVHSNELDEDINSQVAKEVSRQLLSHGIYHCPKPTTCTCCQYWQRQQNPRQSYRGRGQRGRGQRGQFNKYQRRDFDNPTNEN